MGMIKKEEILGFFVDDECVCCDCLHSDEESEITSEQVITEKHVENEDSLCFCNRCQKQM